MGIDFMWLLLGAVAGVVAAYLRTRQSPTQQTPSMYYPTQGG